MWFNGLCISGRFSSTFTVSAAAARQSFWNVSLSVRSMWILTFPHQFILALLVFYYLSQCCSLLWVISRPGSGVLGQVLVAICCLSVSLLLCFCLFQHSRQSRTSEEAQVQILQVVLGQCVPWAQVRRRVFVCVFVCVCISACLFRLICAGKASAERANLKEKFRCWCQKWLYYRLDHC